MQPLRCARCRKHPNRKPRVIELYDWPTILATAPCGCIKIACQFEGCQKTMWRYTKLHSRTGMAVSRSFYCGKVHAAASAAATKRTSVEVPCTYCGVKVSKQPAVLRLRKHVFCRPDHHYIWVKQQQYEAKHPTEPEDDGKALVFCPSCNDVVECVETSKTYFGMTAKYVCHNGHRFKVSAGNPAVQRAPLTGTGAEL